MSSIDTKLVPADIQELYEVHNYRNAAQVLATGCKKEFNEVITALREFKLTLECGKARRMSGARSWDKARNYCRLGGI